MSAQLPVRTCGAVLIAGLVPWLVYAQAASPLRVSAIRTIVAESAEFAPVTPVANVPAGWNVSWPVINWAGNPAARTLVIPLEVRPAASMPLAGFEAVWVDYVKQERVPACRLDFEFRLTLRPLSQPRQMPLPITAATDEPLLVAHVRSKPEPLAWRRKDIWYLAARLLDISSDGEWRFAYGGRGDLVVQRRWHQELLGIDAIDLAVHGNAIPSQVNLIVKNGKGVGTQVITFGGIPVDSRLPDGRPGVRVHVAASPDRDPSRPFGHSQAAATSLLLKEIILFFPAGAQDVISSNPVAEISLLRRESRQEDALQGHFPQPLQRHIQTGAAGHERVIVPLDLLTSGRETVLTRTVLKLTPPESQSRCALRVERARIVNTFTQR